MELTSVPRQTGVGCPEPAKPGVPRAEAEVDINPAGDELLSSAWPSSSYLQAVAVLGYAWGRGVHHP